MDNVNILIAKNYPDRHYRIPKFLASPEQDALYTENKHALKFQLYFCWRKKSWFGKWVGFSLNTDYIVDN